MQNGVEDALLVLKMRSLGWLGFAFRLGEFDAAFEWFGRVVEERD